MSGAARRHSQPPRRSARLPASESEPRILHLPDWPLPDWLPVALVAATLALAGLLLLVALRGRRGEQMARLGAMMEALAAAQDRLARGSEERARDQDRILAHRLDVAADRTLATASAIHERLAVLDASRKNIEALGNQVTSLAAVLGNKQARGALGEVQLRDLVADRLPPSGFAWQHTLSNGTRCDCLIRLPFPPGPIAVDSKFPLEAWAHMQDAADPAARALATRRFTADIRRHVADISEKYLIPGETAEGALMFLPSEAVHATLHAAHADLVAEAARRGVHIVGPSSLWAVLNTMRGLLRDARLQDEARRIRHEVEALGDDTDRLERRVAALRGHFGQVQQDLRDIEITAEKIVRRGEAIRALDIPDAAPEKAAE